MKSFEPLEVSDLVYQGSPVNLEQYCGLWAVEETAFHQQWALLKQMDFAAHVRQSSPRTTANASKPDANGVESIMISGLMTKRGSSLSDAGSTIRIRQAVREARNNPAVKGVLFVIDSPGGAVSGTSDLAADIAALSAEKPTMTFAEDLMASAALWAGSQSRKVYANSNNAVVGSMGVFIGLHDLSGMAAKEGIKPVVIKTGELKGAGFPGSEITDAQKAMWQGLADESFKQFSAAVQQTRKLSATQLKDVARAGVYPAKQAVDLGLIDGIRTYDAAIAELRTMITSQGKGTTTAMVTNPISTVSTVTAPPTISALESWESAVRTAMKSGLSLDEATRHVTATQPDLHRSYLTEFNAKHGQRRSVASRVAAPSIEGTAKKRWDSAIDDLVAQGNSRLDATREVTRVNPALHSEYLAEVNKR